MREGESWYNESERGVTAIDDEDEDEDGRQGNKAVNHPANQGSVERGQLGIEIIRTVSPANSRQ